MTSDPRAVSRFWDLAYPERSYIVAGGATDSLHCPSVLYSRKIIEGTEVVQVSPPPQWSRGPLARFPEHVSLIHIFLVAQTDLKINSHDDNYRFVFWVRHFSQAFPILFFILKIPFSCFSFQLFVALDKGQRLWTKSAERAHVTEPTCNRAHL